MNTILNRTIRIGLWALIPLLFISYFSREAREIDSSVSKGNYEFQSSGVFNQKLHGKIKFVMEGHTLDKNKHYSTLRFQLQDSSINAHSMEFLMCFKEVKEGITGKTFKVAKKLDGFSDYFEGVYGVVNGDIFGELPYFAEEGKITILDTEDAALGGKINMKLRNFEGKSIEVNGNFIAVR